MKASIAAFTENGEKLANEIFKCFDQASLYTRDKEKASDWVRREFSQNDVLVFVGAVGIAVRLIAPYIQAKDKDPAVIVVDEKASFVISLLSGHIGGANKASLMLAKKLGATPVITTATDINGSFAVDVWSGENDCIIDDISKIKYVSSAVLRGEKVCFKSDFQLNGAIPDELFLADSGDCGIYVSLNEREKPFGTTLNVIPKIVTIGIGCRRGTSFNIIEAAILELLSSMDISIKAVKAIASIDLKKDEQGILEFAQKHKLLTAFYTSNELNSVTGEFSPSEFVMSVTGVDNVCQRSAALKSGGKIIKEKTVVQGITLAVAVCDWRCLF